MITIEERSPNKLPGLSSLFVSFNYNKNIVEAIKSLTTIRNYDAKTKEWEIPISDLSLILDYLCVIDKILIKLLEDTDIQKPKEFQLNYHKTKPYKYQEEGIKYGLNHDKFLLLDAPGLGKSLQVIYLAEELKEREGIQHCLIVCGINTLKANWVKEINTHSNLSCRILGQRHKKNGSIKYGGMKEKLEDLKKPIDEFFVVTNIESLRNEDLIKELNNTKNNVFDMIAFDEVHRANNILALLTKGFLKIKQGTHRVAMTATLLTNSPLNAYTPLKWLGVENSTYTNFKYYYCRFSGPFNNILVGYKNIDYLKDQLERFGLRRTKDILDLPPKTIIDEYIDMDEDQSEFYDNIINGVKDQVDKVELNTTNLLAMMGRLRQAADCPSVLTTEKISSAKFNRTIDLVDQITQNGEKVIIFDVFKQPLNDLYEALKDYNPLLCTGDIDDTIISDNIDKFQNDPNYKVILCTTLKMGTGVTLNKASYEIFLNTPYTYAEYELCQDRAHRVTNTKPVFIYNLICKDTVDERVKDIVESKEAISDFVIDDKISPKLKDKLKEIILDLGK